jgi:hypothetical protein
MVKVLNIKILTVEFSKVIMTLGAGGGQSILMRFAELDGRWIF